MKKFIGIICSIIMTTGIAIFIFAVCSAPSKVIIEAFVSTACFAVFLFICAGAFWGLSNNKS